MANSSSHDYGTGFRFVVNWDSRHAGSHFSAVVGFAPSLHIVPLFFHFFLFSLLAPCPVPLLLYFSAPAHLPIRTSSCSLLSLAVWLQPPPATAHQCTHLRTSQLVLFHVYFCFMIFTAMALPMQQRSHDPFLSSFTSFLCRRLAHLSCHCLLPVHASELPGALALSLEHIFYSPQMTYASTMPITCNARKRCLDFCHHYENIRLPHARFGCILSLHPIPSRCIFITPCTIMDSYSSPIILGRILTPVWRI